MFDTLPNILTVSRILAIIPMVVFFYIGGEMGAPWALWAAMIIFVAAAVTDFVDGYLARKHELVSPIGRMLDPIADKKLVVASLFMLVAFAQIDSFTALAALLIVMREIMVSGLRESMGAHQIVVPVTKLAKWKTTVQMIAIATLIVGDTGVHPYAYFGVSLDWLPVTVIGSALLWLAAAITVKTGYSYFRTAYAHLQNLPEETGASADTPKNAAALNTEDEEAL